MERPDLEADNLEIATEAAAQAWCTEDTKHKVMDPILCATFARILASWIGIARQHARNEDYYRGLLDQCAPHLGEAVFTQDDGGKSDSPLRAKIPELVAALAAASSVASPAQGVDPETCEHRNATMVCPDCEPGAVGAALRAPAPAAPGADLRDAAEFALESLKEMNKGIGWKDGEWESVRRLRAALYPNGAAPSASPVGGAG